MENSEDDKETVERERKKGDVDNDKGNEVVIGSIDGEVLIFKGSDSKPWRKCTGLGVITCVEIGDICSME